MTTLTFKPVRIGKFVKNGETVFTFLYKGENAVLASASFPTSSFKRINDLAAASFTEPGDDVSVTFTGNDVDSFNVTVMSTL